jgi:hypothetical protein
VNSSRRNTTSSASRSPRPSSNRTSAATSTTAEPTAANAAGPASSRSNSHGPTDTHPASITKANWRVANGSGSSIWGPAAREAVVERRHWDLTCTLDKLTMIGSGTDLAVAVGVAADPTREVLEHVEADPLIGRLLSIDPSAGPGSLAVPDGRIASAIAEMIRNAVGDVLDGSIDHLHLLLATPAGLALLLATGGTPSDRPRCTSISDLAAGTCRPFSFPPEPLLSLEDPAARIP